MNTEQISKLIANGSPMQAIFRDLLDEYSFENNLMKVMHEEYKGDVPIKSREFAYNQGEKVDRQLPHDFRGYIVDTLTGYLFGNPIKYQVDDHVYEIAGYGEEQAKALKDIANEHFNMFYKKNSLDDLDSETGKYASICGTAARLLYVREGSGDVRIMNVPPWECIFIYDASLDEVQYAMRYYDMKNEDGKLITHIEWYDSTYVTEYEDDGEGTYVVVKEEQPHLFDGVPLIEFPNNEERQGDFVKVRDLIDAYDTVVSDVQSELEEQRLAYMVFMGAMVDEETIEKAKQTGAFNVPEGGAVQYLVKNLNDMAIENQKRNLKESIHKFSKTVDMSDENFSGASQSGESRKWKLLAMENRTITKERKFSKSLRSQFELLYSVWDTKSTPIPNGSIYWTFDRNLPIELSSEADILVKLKGVVSESTRLGLASFIDDVDWEKNEMENDSMGSYSLMMEPFTEEPEEPEEGEA